MNSSEEIPPTDSGPKKKGGGWRWVLGLLLLLVFCGDGDDERRKSYCYTFGEDKRLCFSEPLPKDKLCYLEADNQVRCYDK